MACRGCLPGKPTIGRGIKDPIKGVDNDNGDGEDDRKLDHHLPSSMSRFKRQTNPNLWELDRASRLRDRNVYT